MDTNNQTPPTEATQTPAQPEGDRVWDALNHIHREVMAYNIVPAMLAPHLRDRELLAKVQQQGGLNKLARSAELLNNDVASFRNRLTAIGEKHKDRTGSSTDADDQLEAIQIHEEYTNWGASYDQVVLPVVADMMDTLIQAGAELDRERLAASPTTIIEGAAVDIEPAIDAGSLEDENNG